jgi:hypothetical protein
MLVIVIMRVAMPVNMSHMAVSVAQAWGMIMNCVVGASTFHLNGRMIDVKTLGKRLL